MSISSARKNILLSTSLATRELAQFRISRLECGRGTIQGATQLEIPARLAGTMDEKCCTPGPKSEAYGGGGKETQFAGFDVYYNKTEGATAAVVLFSDVFGWKVPLLRRFADKIAAAGFAVAVPDFFRGDSLTKFDPSVATTWFPKHPFGAATEDTLNVIKAIKGNGYKSVGVAGFCYGGKVAVLAGATGEVDSAVILHPSKLAIDDFKAFKGNLAILSGEVDKANPAEALKEYEECLKSRGVESIVKVYPRMDHGWSVRYDEKNETAVKYAEESHADTITWFKQHLK